MMKIQSPDHIWIHGNILTLENSCPHASAIAVSKGRILKVGSDIEILQLAESCTQITDLHGAYLYPGFIEGHMHLPMYGDSLLTLDIRDRSKEEILALVAQAANVTAPGKWILGGMGWNNEAWTDPSYPTASELDAVASNHPVMLPRMDGHLIWVNSCAFAAAGITADTENPENGEFLRTADGSLQGCASDGAADRIKAAIPETTDEQWRQAFLAAQEQLLRFGVTSINDMATTLRDVSNLKNLYEHGLYKLRFHGALENALGGDASPDLQAYLDRCPEIGLYGGRFTVRACKLLGDGAVGAQSAALKEDYTDRPGHRGVKMYTDDALYSRVQDAASRGMQMIIHAIGDDAIDQVLRVYQRVLEDNPTPDHRWHIEHFQTISSNQPERAKDLGVWVSMQPLHAPNSAAMALRRLGAERSANAYAGGLVLRKLGAISWGSDAPVATPSPLSGIHAAITRTNDKFQPKGGFFPDNAVTPLEALLGYTKWGAYAQFTEQEKGTLAPGKYADFVALDRDLLKTAEEDPDSILQIRVLQTVIAGEIVYSCSKQL